MLGIAAARVFLMLCVSLAGALANCAEQNAFGKILAGFPSRSIWFRSCLLASSSVFPTTSGSWGVPRRWRRATRNHFRIGYFILSPSHQLHQMTERDTKAAQETGFPPSPTVLASSR
jgi:hypothetical protein